jgi:asparagine synthase (glutamine-hydrolysing)
MCGIFGILAMTESLRRDRFGIPNETDILGHRGPDDFGWYLDERVYLGHRRLSIIDLTTGQQPVFNEDKTKCVVFNGEIYNFQELRKELETKGHAFFTQSDTETIIHAYEEWGNDCVDRFRGMFAFAVWDRSDGSLFIARDRLGIKPLFYAIVGDTFYFASEIKAFLQYSFFPRDIDPNGVASFFSLSYIPAPLTIFAHVRKLPAGHTLKVRNGSVRIRQYWDIQFQPDYTKTDAEFVEGFMAILNEAVRLRLIADVPLGAFLSGGLDSGAIVALMSGQSTKPVRTLCIGFGGNVGGHLDEREYAREVGLKFQTRHSEYEVVPDVDEISNEIVKSFDEPFADPGAIPSYYVCKIARENVTVALSGLGGDEVFGGYERYLGFKFSGLFTRIPWFLRRELIRPIVERIPERSDGHYTMNHIKRFTRALDLPGDERYFGFISRFGKNSEGALFAEPGKYREHLSNCKRLVLSYFQSLNAKEPLDKAFYCDIKTYLPDDILACTDRMSMWHSLEVRVPFLDHKLVEFCATIPHQMKIRLWNKKHILKRALTGILPANVLKHRKQGFVGPMALWLKTDMKNSVIETLSDSNLDKHGILNKETVRSIVNEHLSGKENHDKLIWSLIMFQKWHQIYIE